MPHARRLFGNAGEDLAEAFFLKRGFTILERNWNCRFGEIDLILTRAGKTHFVEVKTRRSLEFGYPEEAVTSKKLRHLTRSIEVYLAQVPHPPTEYQADVLAILLLPGKEAQFHYVEYIL